MSLTPEHVAKLAESGISAAFAEAHGVRSISAAEANRLLRRSDLTCGGILFPHPGAEPFLTVRLDVPLAAPDKPEKPLRYLNPSGIPVRAYILPEVREILDRDPNELLFITEGAKKVLSLVEAGVAAVGIPGVYCWAAPRTEQEKRDGVPRELSADLASLPLSGRGTFIAFDSDVASNPSVAQETVLCGKAVGEAGANVFVLRLSPLSNGKKQGIDDILGAVPKEQRLALLEPLMAEARPIKTIPPCGRCPEDFIEAVGLDRLDSKGGLGSIDAALRELAAQLLIWRVDPLTRKLIAEQAISRLKDAGIKRPSSIVDEALGSARQDEAPESLQGRAIAFPTTEPWPDPVNGSELIEDLTLYFKKYVCLPVGASLAISLWALGAHAFAAWSIYPRLAFTSAAKRCGKSRTLRLLAAIVPRALTASSATPAAIFRAIDAWSPTLLLDEMDTFLPENEALRGIINSSHERAGAFVLRAEGENNEPRQFSTWAPVALAAIGKVPGTIEDRSVVIAIKRRAPKDKVEKLRVVGLEKEAGLLRRKMARWCKDNLSAIGNADPPVPASLNDRAADNWRPLLAIADLAGDDWPRQAREAALGYSGDAALEADGAGVELLRDIKTMFDERKILALSSTDIITWLVAQEERRWATWHKGKPLSHHGLGRLLEPFTISSGTIRLADGSTPKGYKRESFEDAWERYVPAAPPEPPRDSPSSDSPGREPRDAADHPETAQGNATPPQAAKSLRSRAVSDPPHGTRVADENSATSQEKPGLWRCGGSRTRNGAGCAGPPAGAFVPTSDRSDESSGYADVWFESFAWLGDCAGTETETAGDALRRLREAGGEAWVDGRLLRYRVATSALPPDLCIGFALNADEIAAQLRREHSEKHALASPDPSPNAASARAYTPSLFGEQYIEEPEERDWDPRAAEGEADRPGGGS